jgi:hypothetical protein
MEPHHRIFTAGKEAVLFGGGAGYSNSTGEDAADTLSLESYIGRRPENSMSRLARAPWPAARIKWSQQQLPRVVDMLILDNYFNE